MKLIPILNDLVFILEDRFQFISLLFFFPFFNLFVSTFSTDRLLANSEYIDDYDVTNSGGETSWKTLGDINDWNRREWIIVKLSSRRLSKFIFRKTMFFFSNETS